MRIGPDVKLPLGKVFTWELSVEETASGPYSWGSGQGLEPAFEGQSLAGGEPVAGVGRGQQHVHVVLALRPRAVELLVALAHRRERLLRLQVAGPVQQVASDQQRQPGDGFRRARALVLEEELGVLQVADLVLLVAELGADLLVLPLQGQVLGPGRPQLLQQTLDARLQRPDAAE